MSENLFVSPGYSRGLTDYMITTRPQYEVDDASLPFVDYQDVCGKDKAKTEDLISQFTRQIGCPSPTRSEWVSKKKHYREQFDKARQCFRGRVLKMGDYAANTPEEKASQQGHAFAAQAAYTIGRDCLRKFEDIPGGVDTYSTSADRLVTGMRADVRDALLTDDTGKKHTSVDGAVEAHPLIGPIYNNQYGLTPAQWEAHKRYLSFSAIDPSAYEGGKKTLDDVKRQYVLAFLPPSAAREGVTAVGGAGENRSATSSNNRTRKNTKNKNVKRTSTMNNRKTKNTKNANLNAVLDAELKKFPRPDLETVTAKEIEAHAKDKSFHFSKYLEWIKTAPKFNETELAAIARLENKEKHKELMLALILPSIYYFTSMNLLMLLIQIFNYYVKPMVDDMLKGEKLTTYVEDLQSSMLYLKTLHPMFDSLKTRIYGDLEFIVSNIPGETPLGRDIYKLLTYKKEMTKYVEQRKRIISIHTSDIWQYIKDEPTDKVLYEMCDKLEKRRGKFNGRLKVGLKE
jgi:hypothetical protein